MSLRSSRALRLQVLLAALLLAAGIVAACDDTFPTALDVYNPDAASQDTGAPVSGDAGEDGATTDAGDGGAKADASDGARPGDGGEAGAVGDGSTDGAGGDAATDANFDAE